MNFGLILLVAMVVGVVARQGWAWYARRKLRLSLDARDRLDAKIAEQVTRREGYKARLAEVRAQHIDTNSVVFIGDDLIAAGDWHGVNCGIGGDIIEAVHLRLGEVMRHKPKSLFIMIGINNLVALGTSPEVLASKYARLVRAAIQLSPATTIHIHEILPVRGSSAHHNAAIVATNKLLEMVAVAADAALIKVHALFKDDRGELKEHLAEDGVHLNPAGYALWAPLVGPPR